MREGADVWCRRSVWSHGAGGASPGVVLCPEHPRPRLFDDVAEEAEVGERHGEAVLRRAGAMVGRGDRGADSSVRGGGVRLKEVKVGAQELRFSVW